MVGKNIWVATAIGSRELTVQLSPQGTSGGKRPRTAFMAAVIWYGNACGLASRNRALKLLLAGQKRPTGGVCPLELTTIANADL